MKFTNVHGLPRNIVSALEANEYNKEGSDFSATELINPPQMIHLIRKHFDEIEVDVSDRFWLLMGSAVHNYLEKHSVHGVVENRLTKEYSAYGKKYILSGKSDMFDPDIMEIHDYKVTSAWAVIRGAKVEWIRQLNIYANLHRHAGLDVKGLKIYAILRDWSKTDALRTPSYPPIPFVEMQIDLEEESVVENYIERRLDAHALARERGIFDDCTPEEKWQGADRWGCVISGKVYTSKRGIKTFSSKEDAERHSEMFPDTRVVYFMGQRRRCEGYCLAAPFCEQKKREDLHDQETGLLQVQ